MNSMTDEQLATTDYVATGEIRERLQQNAPKREDKTRDNNREDAGGPLLSPESAQDLRRQWDGVQASFVDDPRTAVKQADELVANAMDRLAESFKQQRSGLEQQWDRGEDVSTEDLRLALQKYRAFFQRLLAV